MLNRGQLVAGEPFSFFGTGWWGVPSFYFWLVAQSLNLFGDNLTGARMVHALMGIGTVWYTYRIGRVAWSPRAGLIAGALLCVSDFAIQSSRTVTVSTTTQFFWTACFYYLYLALKTRRPLHFVLCGIAAGFTLYGYASGKLLVLSMLAIALYLLVRWGLIGIKRYLPGLALIALAAGLTFAPNALYQLTQKPAALTERYNTVTIFTPAEQNRIFAQYNTNSWGVVIPQQFALVYRAFDVGEERGPFYPTGQPVLPVPWAALWVVGTAYMVFRLGDARFAVLALWLLGGLAGAALTKDTPTLQRAVTMVPTLALIPALFLDRVASGLPPLRRLRWGQARSRVVRWAPNIAIAALVLLIGMQTLTFYFGPYTARANYIEYTLAGRYVEKLDPEHDIVYNTGTPILFGDPSPLFFLAKDVPLSGAVNVGDYLPITDNNGKDVHFLVSLPEEDLFGALQAYYPGVIRVVLSKPDGTPVIAAYHVTATEIEAQRHVTAIYKSPRGAQIERQETRLGTLGLEGETADLPPLLSYPARAEWAGGLVAPAYGTYHVKLDAPAGATLTLDGRTVLTATGGSGVSAEAELVLAKGVHAVRLSGTLDHAQQRIALSWGSNTGEPFPVGPQFLWGGGGGVLLGQSYPAATDPSWFTAPEVPAGDTQPLAARRDGIVSSGYINGVLAGGTNVFATWRGTLRIPVTGEYIFDARTSGQVSLWLDGEMVGAVNIANVLLVWPVTRTLTAGDHKLEVRFGALADGSEFHLFWRPPGGARALLPPSALAPGDGGVWLAAERPLVPGVEQSLFGVVSKAEAKYLATFQGGAGPPLSNPCGIGVDGLGNVYVGDTGNRRIVVYAPDGKVLRSWPSQPGDAQNPAPGEFGEIRDLAVSDDGTVHVLDTIGLGAAGRVQSFSNTGKLLRVLTPETLAMYGPNGIAVDTDGTLYVADTGRHRIVRIPPSSDGTPLSEIVYPNPTGKVPPPDWLDLPFDVVVGRVADNAPAGGDAQSQLYLYLVDIKGRIIEMPQKESRALPRQWRLPISSPMAGASADARLGISPDGSTVYMTDSDRQRVAVLDVASGRVSYFGERGAGSGQFGGLSGIAVGGDGRVYVVDFINGNVQLFTLSKP